MTGERRSVSAQRDVALVEVLDRALGAGVVITGDVTLSLADIDLVQLSLRLVLGSVGTINGERADESDNHLLSIAAGADELSTAMRRAVTAQAGPAEQKAPRR